MKQGRRSRQLTFDEQSEDKEVLEKKRRKKKNKPKDRLVIFIVFFITILVSLIFYFITGGVDKENRSGTVEMDRNMEVNKTKGVRDFFGSAVYEF